MEGKIHKSEPQPKNGNIKKYCLLLFIRGNDCISRTEFVYDKQACNCKCLLIFVLPGQNNVRKKYIVLQVTFYT